MNPPDCNSQTFSIDKYTQVTQLRGPFHHFARIPCKIVGPEFVPSALLAEESPFSIPTSAGAGSEGHINDKLLDALEPEFSPSFALNHRLKTLNWENSKSLISKTI